MSSSFISSLLFYRLTIWSKYLFTVNIDYIFIVVAVSWHASVRRVTKIWISHNKINFTLQTNDIMFIKILKSRLPIIIKLAHVISGAESLSWFRMSLDFVWSRAKQSSCAADSNVWRAWSWWESLIIEKCQHPLLTQQHLQYLLALSSRQIPIIKVHSSFGSSFLAAMSIAAARFLVILNFTFGPFLLYFIFDVVNTLSQYFFQLIFLFYFLGT